MGEISKPGWKQSSSSDAALGTVYESLSERQRLIGSLLNSSHSQRGLPAPDASKLVLMIRDWEPILRSVPDWGLQEAFTWAITGHDPKLPFQAGEVVRAWITMSPEEKEEVYKRVSGPALPAGPPCAWCDGRGWMRVVAKVSVGGESESGQPITIATEYEAVPWNSRADTNGMMACYCKSGKVPVETIEQSEGQRITPEEVRALRTQVAGLFKPQARGSPWKTGGEVIGGTDG